MFTTTLASLTINITGTRLAIAGIIVGLIVGFFVVKRIVRYIKRKLQDRAIARRIKRQFEYDNAQAEKARKERQEQIQRETDLDGLWLRLYNDANSRSYYRMKAAFIVEFCRSHRSSQLPRLSAGGSKQFCDLFKDSSSSGENWRDISYALAPFMQENVGCPIPDAFDKNGRLLIAGDKVKYGGCAFIVNEVTEMGSRLYLYVEPADGYDGFKIGWSIANNTLKPEWVRKVVGGEENPPKRPSDLYNINTTKKGVPNLRNSAQKIRKYDNNEITNNRKTL